VQQELWANHEALECIAIIAQRALVVGALVYVIPRQRVELALRELCEVKDTGDSLSSLNFRSPFSSGDAARNESS
jgi:hypothetical protein